MNILPVDRLRCVKCGADLSVEPCEELASIRLGAIRCLACQARYDIVDGVPFLGDYETSDFIGLIEIVATTGQNPVSVDYFRRMNALIDEYHQAKDKAAFISTCDDSMVRGWWWSHRYHEWLQVGAIIADEQLEGAQLLNVGAGTGADAVRLHDAGAFVTCIDYSPTLTALGRSMLPEAAWVGGFSHVLPFKDESFDVVCANAALHHMRSVPHALREMLRVLKPGGLLFTTGDPVRSDDSPTDEHEFEVFNRHEAVLAGVNEGIVPVSDIYDTLAAFEPDVEIAILADIVGGPEPQGGARIEGGFNDQWIPLTPDNVARLRQCFGSVATRVRKSARLQIQPALQNEAFVSAGQLTSWIRRGTAYTDLAHLAPVEFVDHPFPGERQTWFDLLNGWMRPEPPYHDRQGFKRARWLLHVDRDAHTLAFEVRCVAGPRRRLNIFANGALLTGADIGLDWRKIDVPVATYAGHGPVLCELKLDEGSPNFSFEESSFLVRDRRFERVPRHWLVRFAHELGRSIRSRRLQSNSIL